MKKPMDSDKIHTLIEEALSVTVQGVQLPGIADAELMSMAVPAGKVQHLAAQRERQGYGKMRLSVEVELFLRVSNTEVLSSIECADFVVSVKAHGQEFRVTVSDENDWGLAWERSIEPIRKAALEGMRRDVWNMDETLAEDSYTFQAAMVLLTSELVGPYVDRITTFVGCPLGLVQLIAARLQDAKIWEGDEVRCESWFDPEKGAMAFMLDLMVAEGELIRSWSEEREQYAYREPDTKSLSQFVV